MKNLFLSCSLILCFGFASAQTTPAKTKSATKTDSVYNKKGNHGTEYKSGTKKADSTSKHQTGKKKQKSASKTQSAPARRDTIGGTTKP